MARTLSSTGTRLLFVWLFVSLTSILEAQVIITFDPPGSTQTLPSAINIKGQVTGTYIQGLANGFLREPDGTIISFDVEGYGPPTAAAADINAEGEIVGNYIINDSESYLREPDGTIVTFFPPPPSFQDATSAGQLSQPSTREPDLGFTCPNLSQPTAVNDLGQITGAVGGGPCYIFLRHPNGTFTTFSVPSKSNPNQMPIAESESINLFGQITGSYFENDGVIQTGGFLWEPTGRLIRFFAPSSTYTAPRGINLLGQIAGSYQDTNSVVHGFLRQSDGKIITFDPAGSTDTEADSINARGEIAGYYLGADGINHGFVRKCDGTFINFDVPASQGTFAASINLFGEITGSYFDGTTYHGFIRTPGNN